MSSSSPAVAPKRSFSLIRVLLVIIPALLIAGVWLAAEHLAGRTDSSASGQGLLARLGHTVAANQEMDSHFTDSDGDLVADSPKDVAEQKSPEKLVFSFIGSPDAAEGKDNWKEF